MKRVFFDIFLLISVFIFPWWLTGLLCFLGIFIFVEFYEFIIVGMIAYSIFAVPGEKFVSTPVFFTSCLILLYVIVQLIRNNIILYRK